jgi:predicted RNase H-like HicB family nuclease
MAGKSAVARKSASPVASWPSAPRSGPLVLRVEFDREDDGRWLADVPALPGVMAYGQTREKALTAVQILALRVLADRVEHGEASSDCIRAVAFEATV